ncbi:MAG: LytTR family DNA-binding domain-containing protein [Calditrichia bacterium]
MIRVMIVEDEKPAAKRLKQMLENFPDLQIAAVAHSGKEAIAQIDQIKPEALFLDIHLGDISGIDLLRVVEHKPRVIFTTAFDQYAVEAFRLCALDYLLKPFDMERLAEAVSRLRRALSSQSAAADVQNLLNNWQPEKSFLRRIPTRQGEVIQILQDDDIVFFNTENKLVFAHTVNKKYLINYTLEELQKRLDPETFFRIHRSTIVNLNYVVSIVTWFSGSYKMKVRDKAGTELMISRSAAKELRQKLNW